MSDLPGSGHKLFVGCLPEDCTSEELNTVFSTYGEVNHVHLMQAHARTGMRCAFVFYDSLDAAEDSIKVLNNVYKIREDAAQPIQVRWGREREQKDYHPEDRYVPGGRHIEGHKLFVGKLPQDIEEDELNMVFSNYGAVNGVHIMRANDTGLRGAFIFYQRMSSGEDAIKVLDNIYKIREDAEEAIQVRWARVEHGGKGGKGDKGDKGGPPPMKGGGRQALPGFPDRDRDRMGKGGKSDRYDPYGGKGGHPDRRDPRGGFPDRRDPYPDRRDPYPDRRDPYPDRRDPYPDRKGGFPDRRDDRGDRGRGDRDRFERDRAERDRGDRLRERSRDRGDRYARGPGGDRRDDRGDQRDDRGGRDGYKGDAGARPGGSGKSGGKGKGKGVEDHKLFVSNLPEDIEEDAVRYVFGTYGKVDNVYLMTNKKVNGKIAAFIDMVDTEAANTAIAALHEQYEIREGYGQLKVRVANAPQPKPY